MDTPIKADDSRVIKYGDLIHMRAKMVAAFVNAFGVNNHRYELMFGWVRQKAITHKQFKYLIRNVRLKHIDNFTHKGDYIFHTKEDIIGTYPEDWSA